MTTDALATYWNPAGLAMTQTVDIRIVGLLTLFQAPWSFKFLWSPLMDRYELPFLGRRRGSELPLKHCCP